MSIPILSFSDPILGCSEHGGSRRKLLKTLATHDILSPVEIPRDGGQEVLVLRPGECQDPSEDDYTRRRRTAAPTTSTT